jgi:hypothetical protein
MEDSFFSMQNKSDSIFLRLALAFILLRFPAHFLPFIFEHYLKGWQVNYIDLTVVSQRASLDSRDSNQRKDCYTHFANFFQHKTISQKVRSFP